MEPLSELTLTRKTRSVLAHAQREAGRLLHPAVEPEHILLGILRQGDCFAASLIRQKDPHAEDLAPEVERLLGPGSLENVILEIPYSPRALEFLQQVDTTRRRLNHEEIRSDHLLLTMASSPPAPLAELLASHALTTKVILEAILAEYGVVQQATPQEILLLQGLVKEGRMTPEIIQGLLTRKEGEGVKHMLLTSGFLTEHEIATVLAKQTGCQSIDLATFEPDPALLKQFPGDLARRLHVFPVRYEQEQDTLYVALSDPLERRKLEEIQNLWGVNVIPLLAAEQDLDRLLLQSFPETQPPA